MPPKPPPITDLNPKISEIKHPGSGSAASRRGRPKGSSRFDTYSGERRHLWVRLAHDEWERAEQLAQTYGCSLGQVLAATFRGTGLR